MVRFLLEDHDADIHISNGDCPGVPTPLWMAIILKSLESVALLLQAREKLTNLSAPLNSILIAGKGTSVRFKIEANAQSYIEAARRRFEKPSSQYVRVRLGTEGCT
jgi:hypothetical protein